MRSVCYSLLGLLSLLMTEQASLRGAADAFVFHTIGGPTTTRAGYVASSITRQGIVTFFNRRPSTTIYRNQAIGNSDPINEKNSNSIAEDDWYQVGSDLPAPPARIFEMDCMWVEMVSLNSINDSTSNIIAATYISDDANVFPIVRVFKQRNNNNKDDTYHQLGQDLQIGDSPRSYDIDSCCIKVLISSLDENVYYLAVSQRRQAPSERAWIGVFQYNATSSSNTFIGGMNGTAQASWIQLGKAVTDLGLTGGSVSLMDDEETGQLTMATFVTYNNENKKTNQGGYQQQYQGAQVCFHFDGIDWKECSSSVESQHSTSSMPSGDAASWFEHGCCLQSSRNSKHIAGAAVLAISGFTSKVEEWWTTEIYQEGSVRVFQWMLSKDKEEGDSGRSSPPRWVQMGQELRDVTVREYFGESIALSADGMILAVGAPFYGEGEVVGESRFGAVRVYKFNPGINNGIWEQLGPDIVGEVAEETFGMSVDLSADGLTLAVGAPGGDAYRCKYEEISDVAQSYPTGYDRSGQVRVLHFTAGESWEQVGRSLKGSNVGDKFGWSVGIAADGKSVVGSGRHCKYVRVFQLK